MLSVMSMRAVPIPTRALLPLVLLSSLALGVSPGFGDPAQGLAKQSTWQVQSAGKSSLHILQNGHLFLEAETLPLGPRWRVGEGEALPEVTGDGVRFSDTLVFSRPSRQWGKPPIPAGSMRFDWSAKLDGARIVVRYSARPDDSFSGEGVLVRVPTLPHWQGGKLRIEQGTGAAQTMPLPPSDGDLAEAVTAVELKMPGESPVRVSFPHPVALNAERGALRFWPSGRRGNFRSGEAGFVIELPGKATLSKTPGFNRTDDWWPVSVEEDYTSGSAIGLEDWLEHPAGRHGWLTSQGPDFVFEDGTRAVFWGTNLSWARMAPEVEDGIRMADKYAKYGFNLVRFHKFLDGSPLGTVLDRDDRDAFDPEVLARFDRFHAELVRRGIYVGWSPIYIYKPAPSEAKDVLALDEILAMKAPVGIYSGTFHQLVNVAPDLQDIYIKHVVAMLEHTNPVTGRRYADDPAVAFIELHNEDMIFKDNTGRMLDQCPTYRKQINRLFSEWLLEHYGSEAAFTRAWEGEPREANGESLTGKTIRVVFKPKDASSYSRRELDSFRFLSEFQLRFYQRFEKAIRDTGYRGVIVAGCWQSQYWLPQYYNLFTDWQIGPIDRHNYMRPGVEMISRPGAGLLAAGIQQMADRPFSLSEWASGRGWAGSMDAIIAAYGMGLQGWDLSAQFSSSAPDILLKSAPNINFVSDAWQRLSLHPALARIVRRGDLRLGGPVSTRRFSLEQLHRGEIGFDPSLDLSAGAYLMASTGSVPTEMLAIGRTVIEVAEGDPDPALTQADPARFWDRKARTIRSSTDELLWDYSDLGWFSVDTPGTIAVFGNGGGRVHELRHGTITYDRSYADVIVTADDPGATLADSPALLVTVAGRVAHRGSVLDARSSDTLIPADDGKPLVAEPVRLTLALPRGGPAIVEPLDHDGRVIPGAPQIPAHERNGGIEVVLDGHQHKTWFYRIVFP